MAEDQTIRNHSLDEPSASETAPLLPGNPPQRPRHRPGLSVTSIRSITSINVPKAHKNSTIIFFLYIIVFVASSSEGFIELPLTRFLEDIVCHEYYDMKSSDQPIDERLCKENPIQQKVAYILAILSALQAIVSFFAALPWGVAADKIGRKPVVFLNISGLILGAIWALIVVYWRHVFPLTAIWATCLGSLIGGGNTVLLAIILSMISDATKEEERAVEFMRLHVASLCGNFLSPTLAALVMQSIGPWPSPWIGIALLFSAAVAFMFLPETLRHKRNPPPPAPEPSRADTSTLGSKVSSAFDDIRESLRMLKSPSLVLLILTALSGPPMVFSTTNFMNQFVSKRYHIKIASTGYIQTLYGIAHVIMSLLILPLLSRYLMRPSVPVKFRPKDEQHRDLTLARYSYIFIFVGALILGLSPTLGGFVLGLLVMAIGSGYNSLVRSLMSVFVNPEHSSRLFSFYAMVETAAKVYAQPMLAGTFALGLKWQGEWIGLPYLALAALTFGTIVCLVLVRLPKTYGGVAKSPIEEGDDLDADRLRVI
ncbi:major facilitator superfamily transporter [Xylariaceae sp. FL1272]|nr:major facilitator superfamily transporter [Xylariaceae sp. FL1272]